MATPEPFIAVTPFPDRPDIQIGVSINTECIYVPEVKIYNVGQGYQFLYALLLISEFYSCDSPDRWHAKDYNPYEPNFWVCEDSLPFINVCTSQVRSLKALVTQFIEPLQTVLATNDPFEKKQDTGGLL